MPVLIDDDDGDQWPNHWPDHDDDPPDWWEADHVKAEDATGLDELLPPWPEGGEATR